MPLLIAAAVAMCSTTLRGFQNRAVAANNKKVAMVVGMVMNASDLLVVATLIHNMSGWTIAASAIGAGLGWIQGMYIHDITNRRKQEEEAKAAKQKLKEVVDKRVRKFMKDYPL